MRPRFAIEPAGLCVQTFIVRDEKSPVFLPRPEAKESNVSGEIEPEEAHFPKLREPVKLRVCAALEVREAGLLPGLCRLWCQCRAFRQWLRFVSAAAREFDEFLEGRFGRESRCESQEVHRVPAFVRPEVIPKLPVRAHGKARVLFFAEWRFARRLRLPR